MNEMVDTIKQQKLIYIDDIGTEHQSVKFGERRETFPEIVDEAEKKGKFLIVTTNLSMTELKAKYGERTLDRLRAITKRVKLEGKSLRK
jgi:DNA replication protein DnaC